MLKNVNTLTYEMIEGKKIDQSFQKYKALLDPPKKNIHGTYQHSEEILSKRHNQHA